MKSLGWFLLGAISLAAAGFGLVFFNSHGFSANEKPAALGNLVLRELSDPPQSPPTPVHEPIPLLNRLKC